ncbi:MAG TPA: nitrilase-related carbon-nitrogen hydrolase, partial [Pirellulales bacterium]
MGTATLPTSSQRIDEARRRKVSLLCLPELCITGYGCEDAFYSAAVCNMAQQMLGEILARTKGMAVSVGLPLMHSGALYNVSAMLIDGRIAGLVAKQHLAGDGPHYEPRWFKPWPASVIAKISLAGCQIPLGDLMFDFEGIRVG